MLYPRGMRVASAVLLCIFFAGSFPPVFAQSAASDAPDYSGMYSFLKEGEFMQITIEEKGKVSGFISRYGDSSADKGTFLDQFVKSGTSNGKQLDFTTETFHGVTYSFEGAFERGPGKRPEEEGYYVLRGTLTRNAASSDKKATAQNQQVEFKSFPRDPDIPR